MSSNRGFKQHNLENADANTKNAALLLLAAFFLGTLVMRGPVTALGPVAFEIEKAFAASPSAFGLLTAIPIACFGVFSFAGAPCAHRLGLYPATLAALCVLFAGCALRLVPHWNGLLAATVLVGAGIALLNVYMPVIAKTAWPQHTAAMLGIYSGMVGVSGSIGSLTARPLLIWDGLTGTFGFWALAALFGAALWFWALRRQSAPAKTLARGNLRRMLCDPLAWALTAVMGLQSLLIYTVAAWLPSWLVTRGFTAQDGGFWIFVYLLVGFVGSALTPRLLRLMRTEFAAEAFFSACYLAGAGCWWLGGAWMWPGSLLAGFAQGAMLTVALVLMAQKSRSPAEMLSISAFAQGLGYIGAGLGPLLFGVLRETTGGWTASLLFTVIVMVLWAGAGAWAQRYAHFRADL